MTHGASETRDATSRQALITGASSGIGEAFARRLARDGYALSIVARRADRLEALAKDLEQSHGTDVEVLRADLAQPEELARVEERLRAEPLPDLLVNNAGFGTVGRFHELPLAREQEEIALNVVALVRLSHAALGPMVKRGRGSIINVSSMAGAVPGPFTATYGATKAYVTSFSESLSIELRETGVRVQALCPGFTRTEFQEAAGIDARKLPRFMWMSSEQVVEVSLDALGRDQVIVVPGALNRGAMAALGFIPRGGLRRVSRIVARDITD